MNKLEDTLLAKARENKLGHFYILETNTSEEFAFDHLIKFIHSFIKRYYAEIENRPHPLTNLTDHPDVFIMGELGETDEKIPTFISVEDSAGLNRFFEFKSVQGLRKFAIITEGHRINQMVANKWLKLLEEPHGISTIFLLNPRGQRLLETIHSRAQHLRLPAPKNDISLDNWNEFLKAAKSMGLADFLEKNVKAETSLTTRQQELIFWESKQNEALEEKIALTEWLKTYQELEVFHQPSATKWTLFYQYLQANVLPRI